MINAPNANPDVGASLLANGECQMTMMYLTQCLREQARSHK